MHWGWAGGYRFLVVEGKADNSGDGIPETDFWIPQSGDELYKQTDDDHRTCLWYRWWSYIVNCFGLCPAVWSKYHVGNQIVHAAVPKNLAMINNAVNNHFFLCAANCRKWCAAFGLVRWLCSKWAGDQHLYFRGCHLSLTDLKKCGEQEGRYKWYTYFSIQDSPPACGWSPWNRLTYTNTQK